jgi:hypothetical protein
MPGIHVRDSTLRTADDSAQGLASLTIPAAPTTVPSCTHLSDTRIIWSRLRIAPAELRARDWGGKNTSHAILRLEFTRLQHQVQQASMVNLLMSHPTPQLLPMLLQDWQSILQHSSVLDVAASRAHNLPAFSHEVPPEARSLRSRLCPDVGYQRDLRCRQISTI